MADLVFYGLLLAVMIVVVAFQVRYYVRRALSRNWPKATATIKRGFVGVIARGAGAGFFGYIFTVNGVEYSGRFVLPDNWDHAEKFQHKLDGAPLLIKFCPRNPRVSLLDNLYDSLFEGLVATQNPYWYLNAREKGGAGKRSHNFPTASPRCGTKLGVPLDSCGATLERTAINGSVSRVL